MTAPFIPQLISAGKQVILFVRRERFHAVLLGHEALERADAHRRIDLATAATIFTRRRAHAAVHPAKRIGRTRGQVSFFISPFRNELHITARIRANRAAHLARNEILPKLYIWNLNMIFFGHKTPIFWVWYDLWTYNYYA